MLLPVTTGADVLCGRHKKVHRTSSIVLFYILPLVHLRAEKIFKRKREGQTVLFRIVNSHQ